MKAGRFHVGCSGRQYRHWRGTFYPPDLPVARWLEWNAERLDTVEVNNSFDRLPDASAFRHLDDRRATGVRGFGDRWLRAADVFAYFNTDVGGHAPRDAIDLRQVI